MDETIKISYHFSMNTTHMVVGLMTHLSYAQTRAER